jgi:hypothetical protein
LEKKESHRPEEKGGQNVPLKTDEKIAKEKEGDREEIKPIGSHLLISLGEDI